MIADHPRLRLRLRRRARVVPWLIYQLHRTSLGIVSRADPGVLYDSEPKPIRLNPPIGLI